MNIEWRQIPGFEGRYEVSNTGLIRSVDRVIIRSDGMKMRWKGRLLKYQENKDGYYVVTLGNKGRCDGGVHRFVALAFLPNLNQYRTINHKDGDKHNNNIENLEWMNDSDNIKHAYQTGLNKGALKPIRCIETGEVYNSITEAAEVLGGNRTILSNAIRGGWRYKGYSFEYINKT